MSPCSELKALVLDLLRGTVLDGEVMRKVEAMNICTENEFMGDTVRDAMEIVVDTHRQCPFSFDDFCSNELEVNIIELLFRHAENKITEHTSISLPFPSRLQGWEFLLPLTTSKANRLITATTSQYVFLSAVALLCYTVAPDSSVDILLGEETGWTEIYGFDSTSMENIYSALVLRDVCIPFFKQLVQSGYEQVSVLESTLNLEIIASQAVATGNISWLKALHAKKMLKIPQNTVTYAWDHTDMFGGMEETVPFHIRCLITYEMLSHFHLRENLYPIKISLHIYSLVTTDMFTLSECKRAIGDFICNGSFVSYPEAHAMFDSYIHRLRIMLPHLVHVGRSEQADPFAPYYWLLWILKEFNLTSDLLFDDICLHVNVTPTTFNDKVTDMIFLYCDTVSDVFEMYGVKDATSTLYQRIKLNILSFVDYMYTKLKQNNIGKDRCGVAYTSISADGDEYNYIYCETNNYFDAEMASLYANKWDLADDITKESIPTKESIYTTRESQESMNCVECGTPVRWDNQQLCGYRGTVCDNTE